MEFDEDDALHVLRCGTPASVTPLADPVALPERLGSSEASAVTVPALNLPTTRKKDKVRLGPGGGAVAALFSGRDDALHRSQGGETE